MKFRIAIETVAALFLLFCVLMACIGLGLVRSVAGVTGRKKTSSAEE
jgi:hypothetical protein